jgi:hypothetical protein
MVGTAQVEDFCVHRGGIHRAGRSSLNLIDEREIYEYVNCREWDLAAISEFAGLGYSIEYATTTDLALEVSSGNPASATARDWYLIA